MKCINEQKNPTDKNSIIFRTENCADSKYTNTAKNDAIKTTTV